MLRPTVCRPVCLGVKHPSGAYDQMFITVKQLRVCWCGALSLTRERVCRLQLLLVLARAVILVSESRGTRDHILLSQIRDSPTWRTRSPYLYPPGTGWPSYNPRHWVPFSSPSTTRRATVEVFEPVSTQCTHSLDSFLTVLLITFRHGPHRKYLSSVLFTAHCLVVYFAAVA
jgi:hypothetical protein